MGTLSPIHWILVAIVVLLLFGPKSLAKIGKTVGQSVRSVNNLKQGFVGDPLKAITAPLPRADSKAREASAAPPKNEGEAEPAGSSAAAPNDEAATSAAVAAPDAAADGAGNAGVVEKS